MPSIRLEGYRFFFYSADCREPPHLHVTRGTYEAKIWLRSLEVEWNHGYNAKELNKIRDIMRANLARLMEFWDEHCQHDRP